MHIKTKTEPSQKVYGSKIYLLTLLNDNYTSWEFCMDMLIELFHKSEEEAYSLAQELQDHGEAICGVYTFEIAETKAAYLEKEAKNKRFSLRCLLEQV
ncbi:MAG: ATP-dependent Clp protease adaptor ClpS [Campylobacterales bacterium]|nr:ATP-dependent Clp protease adaptor ClpS [Campylobacterales bacterium]